MFYSKNLMKDTSERFFSNLLLIMFSDKLKIVKYYESSGHCPQMQQIWQKGGIQQNPISNKNILSFQALFFCLKKN